MMPQKTLNMFLLTVCSFGLLGCAAQHTQTPTDAALGSWAIVSSLSQSLGEVSVRQSAGKPTTISVGIVLHRTLDVVDVGLGLPACFEPQTRTVAQWTKTGPGFLVWQTRWLNAGGCDSAQATLLYQFSTRTDGAKGRLLFSLLEL